MDYHGIHVALCTPFRGGGKAVDHRRLRALVNDQIRNGIHGLIPGGSTGEFPALTNEERRAITETVCDAAKGRAPVTVGVGAMSTAESVGLARHAKKAGADAVMVVGPYYEEPTEDELHDYVAAIAGDGRSGLRELVTAATRKASMAVPIISAMKADFIDTTRQASSADPKIAGLGKYSPNTMPLSSLPGPPRNRPCWRSNSMIASANMAYRTKDATAAPAVWAIQ